jgi:glycosyltransferase involved in cell wall biosynthesis
MLVSVCDFPMPLSRQLFERSAMANYSRSPLHVMVATPLGINGRGGIDRMTDNIFANLNGRPELDIRAERLVTRGQGSLLLAQFVFARAIMKLVTTKLRGRIELLHIHLSDGGSGYRKTFLGATARLLRVPYVVHLHGAVFDEFLLSAPPHLVRAIDRCLLHSERIVVLGQYWAKMVADRLPETIHKITILPNATQQSVAPQVPASDNRVRITCLGQLGERKGTPQLLDALHTLASRNDWTATIAGDGNVEQARGRIRELKLDKKVCAPGWLGPAETDELLCNTDIFVLPSFAENLPMSILEAFAHGIPVVSTPVGAIPEVIEHGRNGLIVPPGDVPKLASALEDLIQNVSKRHGFGKSAQRDFIERYEIRPYVTSLIEIWRKSGRFST